ncbi:uncharacterized protein LOC129913821 [Episyrphus balteatus]|uniref:uncharacterized protein LOC129913821 n=1 Tax=Episyrphus balteatus TaxID=286459 RepID=UPI0024865C2E|nr:uncharacterized protein LOC129913821 [Episyrphus balteatus]
MDCKSFMFDLVILNVWINDFDYENNTLTIEVKFNNTEFTIESNPEKPGEFKQGRTCEFKADPEDLVLDLMDHPLKLKILANGEEIQGESEFIWPKEMLEKLERPNFIQYSHFDECDLTFDRISNGKVSIQYRMRVKCEFSESDDNDGEDNVEKHCDIQNELKRIVDPNELFFLIQSDSDMCHTLNEGNKTNQSRPTALDLSRFKSFHGKVVKDPGLIDCVYAPDCCHTKKYSAYNLKQKGGLAKPRYENSTKKAKKCSVSNSSMEWACKATQHIEECPHSNKFSEETIATCSYGSSEFSVETDSESCMTKTPSPCKYPQSPPVLKDTAYIRPRFCPICKSDVSWLPKLAACPKCGHKPTPYTIEKPYNENLTADQILADWAVDSPKQTEKTVPKRINRCTCKNGKVCAYCRIRKICKDVLRPKTAKCHGPNTKCSTETGTFHKDKSTSRICKSSSESDSRNHLAKVFSELQDLYNLKPVVQKREFVSNKKCEKLFALSRPSKAKKKKEQSGAQKKKEPFDKTSLAQAKKKLCRKKLYNYKSVRKYPGTLVGHKACVSSGKVVPGNMGWLWTANTIGIRNGWKPGAIRKPIKEIMNYFLKDYPVDSLNVSRHGRKKISKRVSEELIQKPTLHICKKNGAYVITMRPIKEATLLKSCADPYVPMKPIQFKIVKNPLKACANEIKSLLKKKFDKCSCHKPIAECFCRTFLQKKRLEFELNKACRQKGIPNLKNSLILSDTSESETEFDFGVTPPAGVIKPQLKNKPDLACHETQYNEKDWIIKPTIPKPLNKYMKPFDATGGRALPPVKACAPVVDTTRPAKTRKLPVSGIVGGWGGIGGNKGAGRIIGGGPTNTKPLFCNLARRGKADNCYTTPCIPIC